MTILGGPRSFFKKFLFGVEIEGLDVGWFESCSAIEAEIGVVEYREGGSIVVANQSPGLYKTTPVTLKIGATANDDLWTWWNQVIDAEGNVGEPDDSYKKNVAVVQLDRDGTELGRWNLISCFPNKFVAAEFDAKAEENVMQELVLVYQRFGKG